MTGHRFTVGAVPVWRDVLLRSAGFPVDGLDRFAAPEAARAADALVRDGEDSPAGTVFDAAFGAALRDGAAAAEAVAADPLFREAVTWQNPAAIVALDGLVTGDRARNVRRRERERLVVRYWQRYCAKCETIGFFGPLAWVSASETDERTSLDPGPALTARRRVFFEAWALAAYADRLAGDPAVRRWWPPVRRPHLALEGRRLIPPLRPPVDLLPLEAALLAGCDGRTPARQVIAAVRADAPDLLRSEPDGYLVLDRLVARGLLSWDGGLPRGPDAERVLGERISAIGDPAVRGAVQDGFARLGAARDAVAAAAGDPAGLHAALADLDAEFTTATGVAPLRRDGQMYAGRTLVYEDASRDVHAVIGRRLLDEIAAPLGMLLHLARWLTAEAGGAAQRVLAGLYTDLRRDGAVRLADLWTLAQGPLFTAPGNVGDSVAASFTSRWSAVLGAVAGLPPAGAGHGTTAGTGAGDITTAGTGAGHGTTGATGTSGMAVLRLDGAALAAAVRSAFPAQRPGWPSARVHSIDLQVCAPDVDAINHGDYIALLSELHPAVAPFDSALFSPWHPDPVALRAALDRDIGPSRIRPLYPEDYPRQTGRTRHGLSGPADCELGVADTAGACPATLLPAASILVQPAGDGLTAVAPDGRRWPLVEVFGDMLGARLLDVLKLLAPGGYTPRLVVDRLVLARRTWRTTVGGTGLAGVTGERERFLAARRWRAALGLPERVFVKVGTETKPFYVDFRGPAYVQVLCTMLRAAARDGGAAVAVAVSEMLPAPEDNWLADAAGRRYVSELRLQVTDPRPYQVGEKP